MGLHINSLIAKILLPILIGNLINGMNTFRTARIAKDVIHLPRDGSPRVTTVNDWLGQGISVTRDQGLEFANQLLKSKKVKNDIVLDAKWWRSFLERNKRKLACADR